MDTNLIYEDETYAIRGAIYEVYKTLGTGYLEEVYQNEDKSFQAAFSAAEGVSEHSVVKISTKTLKSQLFSKPTRPALVRMTERDLLQDVARRTHTNEESSKFHWRTRHCP